MATRGSFRTVDVARAAGTHENTVRLYVAWGFLAEPERAANGYIDVAAMRATAQKAAYALEAGLPAGAIAGAAYWWACRGADRVVHTAQHQHGGTGADTSYPIHRFFLAAKQLSMLLGGAAPALERIGRELAAGRVRPLTLEAMP